MRRRLRLRYLIRQLGISPLCGDDGDDCLCYVNEEAELVTIENSASQHTLDVHMPVQDRAVPPRDSSPSGGCVSYS